MLSTKKMKHLQIQDISLTTDGFADKNLIEKGGFGEVYEGISEDRGHIAIKRLDRGQGKGDHEFKTEIALLSVYEHENIVSLLGFFHNHGNQILGNKYQSNRSLDN
ncbi:putative protein kinase RLK-Pelle-LRR-VIII-1 family [Helianthus annuus]|nr:putative protein kinase RLK-Pelle-LRR-VIII-1 family [Helianthus annuus]